MKYFYLTSTILVGKKLDVQDLRSRSSRYELETTGFLYHNSCNKKLVSNNQVNKQKLTSHHQSIKW